MTLDELLSEIQEDKAWRNQELIHFENILANAQPQEQILVSKALILLLYSHFEGHVKFIFTCYVEAINQLNLTCGDVITPLVASSLDKIFEEFKNTQRNPRNNSLFKQEHTKGFLELGRRVEFLENFEQIMTTPVNLETGIIVDTESNLTKKVLLKILFRIGFDNQIFEPKLGIIEKLIEYRNHIAHGNRKNGWTYEEYNNVKNEIEELIRHIRSNVIRHFSTQAFKKSTLDNAIANETFVN